MATDETSAAVELDDDDDPPIKSGRFSVLRVNTAFWVLIIDLLAVGLFGLLSPDHVFLTPENMTNIALDSAAITLIAAGVAVLLGAGELDISIGANIILASVIGGKVMFNAAGGSEENYGVFTNLGWGIAIGVIVTICCGVIFGLINGLIVTKLKVNSFITTLGTLGIGTGVALVITGGGNVEGIPTELQEAYGVRTVFQVPLPFIVSLVLIGFIWWLVNKTRFGVHSLAIGSSREAARRAGIKIERNVLIIFVLVGFLAGVAAVLDLARFTSTNVGGHQTDALAAIAGAVIGGTALFGGKASITGAFFGSLLAVLLLTGLVILGFPPYFQSITIGVVLIAAVFSRARSWAIKNET
jgi:ribose transport system permease protein